MGVRDQLVDVKLKQSTEICRSFKLDLKNYKTRGRVPTAAKHVVNALERGITCLESRLVDLHNSDLVDILNDDAIETRIHYLTRYIPQFVQILSLLESSRLRDAPYEVASPLQKELQKVFPDSKLLVVATSRLNYSILELSHVLRDRLNQLECEIPSDLPDKIFRVAIPSTSYKKALLISIFAHEVGHPLCSKHDIVNTVMPVSVDKHLIKKYLDKINQSDFEYDVPLEKAKLRGEITETINDTILNWIEEITADLFALRLFGPSYVYAFIYLVPTISRLDSASKSHPSPRLRLRVLIKELKHYYDIYISPSNKARSFIKDWEEISQKSLAFDKFIGDIAYRSMQSSDTFEKIKNAVRNKTSGGGFYKNEQFKFDVNNLKKFISKLVPPVEIADSQGATQTSDTVSILNGGWDSYLRGLDGFKSRLGPKGSKDEFDVSDKFNQFMLKSLELSDAKRSWSDKSASI